MQVHYKTTTGMDTISFVPDSINVHEFYLVAVADDFRSLIDVIQLNGRLGCRLLVTC